MMSELHRLTNPTIELLALGEPAHRELSFGAARNLIFERLVELGFRSIAVESDRVAAIMVDDYVRAGVGTLDRVLAEGFSHEFGAHPANRSLVAWMRSHNERQPPERRLAWYGFDAPMETLSAPSPRRYLEQARDYLDRDLDLAPLLGPDVRWESAEALLHRDHSPGASAEAGRLRDVADDLLISLHARAPELIGRSSLAEWQRVETHLKAGIALLRYHRQAAQPVEDEARWTSMCATRDVLMVENLLEIRRLEAGRGPTLVFANNLHLQRQPSSMDLGPMRLHWNGAGAILAPRLGERYRFVAGSLGGSARLGLEPPAPDTLEAWLQQRVDGWGLIAAAEVPRGRARSDARPEQGYFPLDQETVEGADAILHIADTTTLDPARPVGG